MVKVRRNRMPGNWQENTQVRSGSSILAGKQKLDGLKVKKVKLQEQLQAAQKQYKKLTDEINRLEKRLAGAVHGSDLHGITAIKLQKRKEMLTRLWAKMTGPSGLVARAQKEQKRELTLKENFDRQVKEHSQLNQAISHSIEMGKKAMEERPRPQVLKQKIDTTGGVRRVVTVGKKRFSKT